MTGEEQSLDEDKDQAKKNNREATIWIEGLGCINKLAGGSRKRGINLCVDLSATPFYIQGSGNEVGKPFPWIVSDFGLLDAIESGLVKIPQLPSRDVTGADEAAYFNIWRWVQAKAKEEGYGSNLTPAIVMNYASAPINLLAAEWHQRFQEWESTSKQQHKHPVPPVFIVVCRDTAVAKEVYSWLANGDDSYGVSPPWFKNQPGQEVTVRIDSKVIEDIEEGGTKDETRRLRFILETTGKAEWPGGKIPEDWSELVRKHNEKVASEDNDGSLKWMDERIPAGPGYSLHRVRRHAGRGMGCQHGHPYRRTAPLRLSTAVRAGRRSRPAPQELCAQRRNPDVRRRNCQGLRGAVRAYPVQGVSGRPDT